MEPRSLGLSGKSLNLSRAAGDSESMQFESHFKSYFGNVKAFNLKEIKIIAEPVAAMAGGGPAAGGRRRASSRVLRQSRLGSPGPSEAFDLNPSNPFQKPP